MKKMNHDIHSKRGTNFIIITNMEKSIIKLKKKIEIIKVFKSKV